MTLPVASRVAGFRIRTRKKVIGGTAERPTVSWEQDGFLVGDILFAIDPDRLAAIMGPKAMSSKRHISKLGHGAIIATAVNVRKAKD